MRDDQNSPIVISGFACRVPGADSVEAFEQMLFDGRTGYGDLPPDRCDRALYFDPVKGKTGRSYTTLGGIVPERPLKRDVCPLSPEAERLVDVTHLQFAEVAATAWKNAGLAPNDNRLAKTGIYVGHSGGTKSGGGLSLGTQIEEALSCLDNVDDFRLLPADVRKHVVAEITAEIRRRRPSRRLNSVPCFNAYHAAALASGVLGLTGPRSVIDAACASSLVALAQAIMAIRTGRIDSAIVGGATYNNVDNLILFSHSQACTATDSRPFDDGASGLVSSEGYVAIVVTTLKTAQRLGLPVHAVIRGVGMASDGRGRSLWAPRMEGQVLALQRAYSGLAPLDIDYMEAHATSTQLGDATELETLRRLSQDPAASIGRHQLLLGSVKSNIGHTLEAAGLIGVVKVLIAMKKGLIPPSLRYENPNHNYDWSNAPVRVVSRTEPWPEASRNRRARRAAVSAFGIGGLNAHAVVEAFSPNNDQATPISAQRADWSREPIAIVGRGIVVSGASNAAEFGELLKSNRTAIAEAPADRWRDRIGVSADPSPGSHQTPHCQGGFIREFAFDGARYRIPPKQVQQANPVQMMLIDAVSQALAEVNGQSASRGRKPDRSAAEEFPVDRQKVSVVIGTIFGGEFGDQLQVGMRLPEICQLMEASLQKKGMPVPQSQTIATEFKKTVLKSRPALLDETGSFTASTLASRVAKTFDLMGGACALDSDDASGLAALAVAADQLRAGMTDMVVCGCAQRSMSLSAFEALDMTGRLVRSGRPEDVPDDCRQIIPGEGVVAVMLCRLSDAEKLGLPVYGLLGDTQQDSAVHVSFDSKTGNTRLDRKDAQIVRKIGYLSGAHSIVRIVAESLLTEGRATETPVAIRASDGIVMEVPLYWTRKSVAEARKPLVELVSKPATQVPAQPELFSSVNFQVVPTMISAPAVTSLPSAIFRFAATSGSQLVQTLKDSQANVQKLFADQGRLVVTGKEYQSNACSEFPVEGRFRTAIVASSADQLKDRLSAAVKSAEAGKFRTVLDRERVVMWQTQEECPRVAWLFPGQGSHYADSPTVFAASESARRTLSQVDDLYAAANLPRLSTAFGNAAIRPGEDVWWAQAWVLGVSASLTAALRAEGLRPDAVLGHSFGEFTASLASGVTTLAQTIELARHRANAVMSHMRTPGGLLSVRAAVHEVDAILKSAALPVYVTHLNSPRQTVIAGSREGIAAAKALLDSQGFASMSIAVPAPFHTPMLAEAEIAFERMSASVPMRPPVFGFLSATSVQYLAEPSGVRHSLVRQLTQPVMYMPSIQRMTGEGFRVFLEVGPNDVLTRMNRDIVDSQALCLSLDVPGQSFEDRLMLVHAVLECVNGSRTSSGRQQFASTVEPVTSVSTIMPDLTSGSFDGAVFDVTRSRRAVKKTATEGVEEPAKASVNTPAKSNGAAAYGTVAAMSSPPVPAPVPQTSSAFTEAQLRTFVRDLVVELTGYSPEIVDFEADLEADLGVDSIKKAQILGELGEWMGLTVRPESLRLDSVRTLDDAIRVAQKMAADEGAGAEAHRAISTPPPVPAPTPMPIQSTFAGDSRESILNAASAVSAQSTHTSSHSLLPSADRLDSLLIDYVVDQTGYSRDIVDIDADLEADLGLDSIKLAQLIGEMRDQFNLESITLESIAQARFRTLRGIREFLFTHAGAANPAEQTSAESETHRHVNGTATRPVAVEERSHSQVAFQNPVNLPTATYRTASPAPATTAPAKEVRGIEPVHPQPSTWSGIFQTVTVGNKASSAVMEAGVRDGETHRDEIRSALRSLVHTPMARTVSQNWSREEAARLQGLAAGAGVSEASVRLAAALVRDHQNGNGVFGYPQEAPSAGDAVSVEEDDFSEADSRSRKTNRYALRVVPAPRRTGMPLAPELRGAVLILGSNPVADAIASDVQKLGQKVFVLDTSLPIAQIEQTLTQLWQHTATPHLFLTMSFDANSAKSLGEAVWKGRRSAALENPFRICQMWMQQSIDSGLMEDASVIAVTQLGGDFGFSGKKVQSIEAIGGLVKAMLIEAWMRGFRTTPMKVVDISADLGPKQIAAGVLQELAVPSYDMEIAFRPSAQPLQPERHSVQAVASPLRMPSAGAKSRGKIKRGGTWVITGGGRGITAVIAMTLAKKYDLRLHLLGTAPAPALSDDFVHMISVDRSGVRRGVMQEASSRGDNPVEAWRNTEKAIEIDATLRECRSRGIAAEYHCCDVSDFADVERAVRRIRQIEGPINGVIHGAGAGQDARFDRKRPDKVDKCLKAKIDGSLALMQATLSDPLEFFVTFGSISGRFGANGHTDYSLANDMMAKIVDRYRTERPEVRSLTFHWHAWGDIGMATKPEAKLALEMIDMEFMPASDGIEHFMRELELGGDEPEVLITDESYFRKFFPADRLSVSLAAEQVMPLPLIPATVTQHADSVCSSVVTLNPVTDRFLSQHRVQGRPTLPFVVALELMAEAVRVRTGSSVAGVCTEARALQAIRFSTDDPLAVTIQTRVIQNGAIECRLLADVRRRDGRMVEEDREYFRAVFETGSFLPGVESQPAFERPVSRSWKRIEYVAPEGLIYHGPELQELRELVDDGEMIFGRIAASAPVQLFGAARARGFTVPCATMDACLYAVGYAAWNRHQKPSLPVRFDRIEFGRLPDPGEPCVVRILQTDFSDSGAMWDFQLQGHNGDRLLTVNGYRIGWLKSS